MRPAIKPGLLLGVALLLLASGVQRAAAAPVSRELRTLAARAEKPTGWPALRRYAQSARAAELRGLAYFVLGYREYEAGEYLAAVRDLKRAVATDFSLADFAQYYLAVSADKANQVEVVLAALEESASRYPESSLRAAALELWARSLLRMGRAGRAIQVLTAEPRVRRRPALALLLARAYWDAGMLTEAARAFQEIYYAFPAASEADAAGDALGQLKPALGNAYPEVPLQIQTARADILYRRGRYAHALDEYDRLSRDHPQSPFAPRWLLGRARCLLRLRRTSDAITLLEAGFPEEVDLEPERLAMLVEAHRRRGDRAELMGLLEELRERFPHSPSYASALAEAGNFFVREGEWETAARHYGVLVRRFPQSELAPQASWRVAWASYLRGDGSRASEVMLDHLRRYPQSPYIPGALYWLGRLAEEEGNAEEARFLYQTVRDRFKQSYYARQAAKRSRGLPPGEASKTSLDGSQTVVVAAGIPSPASPPLEPCLELEAEQLLRPFLILRSLALDALAERYARNLLEDNPSAHPLRLALSQLEAESNRHALALFNAVRIVRNYSDYGFAELPEQLWRLSYPRAYWSLVRSQARANGLDASLVMAMIRQESAFNPRATSPANARGLMQILPQTASRSRRRRASVAQRLYDPAYNLRTGCRYLRGRLRTLDGKVEQALAAYHAGPSRVRSWLEGRTYDDPVEFLESIPIPATRTYVERVLRDAETYRMLLTGKARFANCRPAAAPGRRARRGGQR